MTSKLHERERSKTDEVLGEGSRRGLTQYLTAMRNTFERQWERPLSRSTSPWWWATPTNYSASGGRSLPGLPAACASSTPAAGWSTTPHRSRFKGGAVVLVSDDLDVVSLRIYQQVGTPSSQAITVETVRPTPGGEAFAAHVRSLVRPEAEPWSTFVAAVDELVSERRDAMRMILEGELELLRE